MRYLLVLLALVGLIGTSFAESDYVLTPFDVVLSQDSFTEKGPSHYILILEKGQSATIDITIQNNDDKPHDITLKNPRPLKSNLFDAFSFEPKNVTVPPHQKNSTKLFIKIAEDTNVHSSFTTFLAQSDKFGMKGIGFVLVVDGEIDELTDKSLRAGLPGPAFPQLNVQITEKEAGNVIDNGFGTPQYIPKGYQFRGMTDWGESKQLLYSPVPVNRSTGSVNFWNEGGLMINYHTYIENPNINNTKSLPVRIAQEEGQQIMINDLMGMAIEKQTRAVAYSDIEYEVPAEVEFFNDTKRSLVSLKATMPLDDLLRVASSIPDYEEGYSPLGKSDDKITSVSIIPPLKQLNSGISYNDIQCRDGKILVLKEGRTFPACVNRETVPKLFERGWALPEVAIIDPSTERQEPKTVKITGVVNRFDTHEGFEYQFIPLRQELSKIAYTGYETINLVATKDTIHRFIRDIDGDLVKIQGSFLLNDEGYQRHFSGFPIIPIERIDVLFENQDLNFTLNGADLVSITKVPDTLTLNIVLEDSQGGILEITVPRELIDAKISEDIDDLFFVFIDGEEVPYTETTNEIERTLTIQFGKGSKVIEIMGAIPL